MGGGGRGGGTLILSPFFLGRISLSIRPCRIIVVLTERASPRLLAYAVPVLMLFSLAWLAVVDFRFATSCWEGYHFWIPVVEYVWYIQYTIFPL